MPTWCFRGPLSVSSAEEGSCVDPHAISTARPLQPGVAADDDWKGGRSGEQSQLARYQRSYRIDIVMPPNRGQDSAGATERRLDHRRGSADSGYGSCAAPIPRKKTQHGCTILPPVPGIQAGGSSNYDETFRITDARGLCSTGSLMEHESGFGIGVLRAKRSSPCVKELHDVHGRRRFQLHDRIIESTGDQGPLEGYL
jgi:hypothetical protein